MEGVKTPSAFLRDSRAVLAKAKVLQPCVKKDKVFKPVQTLARKGYGKRATTSQGNTRRHLPVRKNPALHRATYLALGQRSNNNRLCVGVELLGRRYGEAFLCHVRTACGHPGAKTV
ncbi:hypothetical protein K504DRAFT_245593 [Pleomassaria siparia CBS 279.74]|uniref:Uncharacterized protein n=1 Tax=Pleomassaria siparia CBS 279.74 TaxID=1314801 RepID=A0A6G1JPH2_9PLEO|nr:hypothetical protein K504DRAFT_245593 [Pleomassaria siparia CBS 279.74]